MEIEENEETTQVDKKKFMENFQRTDDIYIGMSVAYDKLINTLLRPIIPNGRNSSPSRPHL